MNSLLLLVFFSANLQRVAASQSGSFLYFASSPVCLFAVFKSTRHIFRAGFGVLFTIFCCVWCNRLHANEGVWGERGKIENGYRETCIECERERQAQK